MRIPSFVQATRQLRPPQRANPLYIRPFYQATTRAATFQTISKNSHHKHLVSTAAERSQKMCDPILAKPSGPCCLKSTAIDSSSQEAKGKIENIEGIDTYIATAKPEIANGNIILYFPDAFGLHMKGFLMMDAFAACGYLTLGVDYFLGVWANSQTPKTELSAE